MSRITSVIPTLPGSISEDHKEDIELLYELVHGRQYRRPLPNYTLSLNVTRGGAEAVPRDPAIPKDVGQLKIRQLIHAFEFFDKVVEREDVEFEFTKLRLAADVGDVEELLDAGPIEDVGVRFVTELDSELMVSSRSSTVSAPLKTSAVVDILDQLEGGRMFHSSLEVDKYLEEERASWD